MWDPAVYHRYGSERSRPFADLTARIGAEQPRAVVDLGCGPGELTATLAERWPNAAVTGLDSSPDMIAKARTLDTPVTFGVADVRDWRPAPDVDVLVTNAALQWVPGHQELLGRWARELPSGAWIAMQVPGNFDAPSHRALREVARSAPFAAAVGDLVREVPVEDPMGYAELLLAAGARVDAWETTYLHLLPDDGGAAAGATPHGTEHASTEHPVLRWMEGTALRPVRAALDEAAWRDFRVALAERLTAAYPARNSVVAFPFRRIFVVARTPS
jgi:trans-aconitate 2-methyltransferase